MSSDTVPEPAALLQRIHALEAEVAALESRLQAQEAAHQATLTEAGRLRVQAARHELVAEAAHAAQWEWDLRSDRIALSGRWGQIAGEAPRERLWTLEELKARVHPDDLPALLRAAMDAIKGESSRYLVEHRVASRHGWAWIESVGMVTERDAQGRALTMSGYNIDITARRQLHEEMARARAQAEASSRAKSEFVANMSHEVRTPLNALLGLARLLHQSPLDSEQRHYVALIDSAATALLALLNDVLDLSKIESGKLVFEQVRFDLHQWLRDVVELHAGVAREKGLALRLVLADDLPRWVAGDPGRLRQVMGNLVSNAVKFTAQGEVVVRAEPLPVVAPEDAGEADGQAAAGPVRVRFEVRDTGIGIAAGMHGAIFEAFTQADSSITRSHGGTGLGLSISARLVAMMGGQIRVQSAPGQGSCFSFDVLLQRAAGAPGVLPEAQPNAGLVLQGLHVLVAEDHPVNALLMRKLLEPLGCRVTVAGDGAEAVRTWESADVDLVLMDLQMPVLSGFGATLQIRAREQQEPERGHTPIVALTAHAMAGDRDRCLAAGMDAYASKPVSPATLIAAVEEAIVAAYESAEKGGEKAFAARAAGHGVARTAEPAPKTRAADALPGVDRAALLALLGGNEAALKEAAQAMRADLSQRLQGIEQALADRNARALAADAHALRGALAAICAPQVARLAHALEDAATQADWPGAGSAAQALLPALLRVDEELALWLREPG
ncbi:ATP-binding protein [Xenophilus arseniciresistens]|uniref:Sensory/regulatory protein RpfC n=1 Tax=Xenophilus arseniciresistens TaxID=1283306 RepID=A0AAE3SY34_9BURK|nr:ATP-binding protein [Xenophilus arseniciresistens]MDA7415667.1 ATP-binding protein [Xenophilus arseniciresistens]